MAPTELVRKAATAHLAKWEPFRPISDRSLVTWAEEQYKFYSVDHRYGRRPDTETIVWMSMECARLGSAPTPDETDPNPPPEQAIHAWMVNQLEIQRAKDAQRKRIEDQKREAKAKRSTPAPEALRKLRLFKANGMAEKSALASSEPSGADCPVTTSSAGGSLSFWRAEHDESKCDFCQALASIYG